MIDHLSRKTRYSWQKVLHFNVIEPVTKDHLTDSRDNIFMANGMVFQDRFYCMYLQGRQYRWLRLGLQSEAVTFLHPQQIADLVILVLFTVLVTNLQQEFTATTASTRKLYTQPT